MKIQVYDPPMCCSTGVCGPAVDPALVRFAADLEWLALQGVAVERFNLSQEPAAFVGNEVVKAALQKDGNDCLPLTLADGAVVSKGKYPSRVALAGYAGVVLPQSLFTDAVKELVAIGASIASNCETCLKYHFNEARKLGVSKEDMRLAVETAQAVKESPARSVLALADKHLADPFAMAGASTAPCCSGAETPSGGKCC